MPFDSVDPKQSFPDLERGILKYWQEEEVFKRSLKHREKGQRFSFYDGPPFATGLPHYGHILAGTIKDVIPRFQTMKGKYVRRRFGWDCHGLPVENEIEKEQGLKSKRDIERIGISTFNALCRKAVQRYTNEWRTVVERLGRWVDMDWDYRTMDPDYMESIWWVVSELHKKGLIEEGHKPMHVCPRCQTPLSNFEVTQGYKDVSDYTVTAKFALKDEPNTFVLAWTTTPWTLPGNLFLAVHPETQYVKASVEGQTYIVAKARAETVFKGKEWTLISEHLGKELIGKNYTPLFPYYLKEYSTAFRIVAGDFVTTEDGTGIVHIAPGFGEDDFAVGKREGVPLLQHIGMDGRFMPEVKDFALQDVKPKEEPNIMDKKIAQYLKEKNLLWKSESFTHSYPHCWRCDSPLLNYATSSWFVAVEKIKEKLLKANAQTTWMPGNLRDGRFGKWLEGARDWAISRNRYWGTPLPIWRNTLTGETEVISSRDALMSKAPNRFSKIIITRHAESQGNVDKIYQGEVPGTDLTAKGKKQATSLAMSVARELKGSPVPPRIVYCSPLARTRQTAEALAKKLNAELRVDDRLREVQFGEYEGKHIDFDDLAFLRARRAHKLETNQIESVYHFQGMETWEQIEKRCRSFLSEILPQHIGEPVVIVTHADILMNFHQLFTGVEKHKVVHQPYPEVAGFRTFFFDHQHQKAMDLHKDFIDNITWMPKKKATKKETLSLTLVRHGETDWNKEERIQGCSADRSITAEGKAQAEKFAASLHPEDFDIVVCSDLKRAHETAEIIANTLKKKLLVLPLLREQDLGDWDGKTVKEITALHPEYGDFLKDEAAVPNGEHREAFLKRIRTARTQLLKQFAGKRVLAVSHRRWICGFDHLETGGPIWQPLENCGHRTYSITPRFERIEEVLDCWFESGAMPYAQEHFPFAQHALGLDTSVPPNFPANFIAEGLDQTRGWFYTLMVLSAALFEQPAFEHVVVNGTVLAEDGKKMSKRLKNYPDPLTVVEKHGADAVRFALMSSPAVHADDLRFSEKLVEETVRSALLPLWNSYRLLVTYANAAQWTPSLDFTLRNSTSTHSLDAWVRAKAQELTNTVTLALESYDLAKACSEIAEFIDDLTNWYIRLSRRRFAGKAGEANEALDTLYRTILTTSQLLAPFCPFIAEAIYLNLVPDEHGSIHFTDWPASRELTEEEKKLVEEMRNTQTVVRLGLRLRTDAKIPVRTPLQSVSFALPADHAALRTDLVKEELNIKECFAIADAASLAERIVQVDARKLGPRIGGKVQDVIRAAKAGEFLEEDGLLIVLGEKLTPEEAKVTYRGREGANVAADHGIVISLDTRMTPALELEGQARELIHALQQLRKDAGLEFTDSILLDITGADTILESFKDMIERETKSRFEKNDGAKHEVALENCKLTVQFIKSAK